MNRAPKGNRLHLVVVGRRNVGKSSLINSLANQEVSLVSDVAGTTTDPVTKAMELAPLGPVLLIDTAGIDDVGTLGEARMRRTRETLDQADLVILVTDQVAELGNWDPVLMEQVDQLAVPWIEVLTKVDSLSPEERTAIPQEVVAVGNLTGEGVGKLKERLAAALPKGDNEPAIVGDLLKPGDMAVLVIPLDKQAPKGRLILPQVQTIRDLIDHGCQALVVREKELAATMERLGSTPDLVITDSQIFAQVAAMVPDHVPLTSFSILFARYKGDLALLQAGCAALETLSPRARILIAETCTHRPTDEDIGRVKIPNLLRKRLGNGLEFHWSSGNDFPADLEDFDLVIHCGGCMVNRQTVLSRLRKLSAFQVPVVNYGMLIAHELGILTRALQPLLAR